MKKNGIRRQRGQPEEFLASDDPVQTIYENVRDEAFQKVEPPSWALERVRQYGSGRLVHEITEATEYCRLTMRGSVSALIPMMGISHSDRTSSE
jgi:hypothetical protein